MFRGKRKWGDWLGLLSLSPCHQLLAASYAAPKKAAPPKPPVTRSKTRNQPTPTSVAAMDLETNTTAPVDAEYDTDELAELPTDSESGSGRNQSKGKRMVDLRDNDN